MHVLEVSPKISTLCECFLTEGTLEGSQSSVLSEVISQVATFLENTPAMGVPTLEVKLYSLGLRVLHSDRLMPLLRYSLECLMFRSSRIADLL